MATASTAISSVVNLQRPNPIRICFKEAKYEFLKNLRNPMYSVSTVLFPLMFYVLFGLVMGRQMIGGVSTTVYLIPAYGTFGVTKLVLTLVAGSLPFCAMGLAIGYFAGPTSAPAVINIFYLPMSFFSGLWMPFMFLPKFIQHIAVFLPPYHLSQLALSLIGAGRGEPSLGHWEALIGFTMLCLGVARWGHQRDQKANG